MAGKEVATKKKTDVAAFDMFIFEEEAGVGNENIAQDELALPGAGGGTGGGGPAGAKGTFIIR